MEFLEVFRRPKLKSRASSREFLTLQRPVLLMREAVSQWVVAKTEGLTRQRRVDQFLLSVPQLALLILARILVATVVAVRWTGCKSEEM